MPTLFVCHGGGPFPLQEPPVGGAALTEHLRAISTELPEKPKAILVISAHWEDGDKVAVTASVQPPMLFDYYGFPPHTYEYQYNAPGDPALASRVCSLLTTSGHQCRLDETRGFDHGVFVPLMLAYPAADIPVVCVSLHRSLDAKLHLSMGRALRPLRDEGVLVIGSGMSFHNMRAFDGSGAPAGARFDEALVAAVTTGEHPARATSLAAWTSLPDARECHPREEHLLPLMVAAGAATDEEPATRTFGGIYMGVVLSSFRFG